VWLAGLGVSAAAVAQFEANEITGLDIFELTDEELRDDIEIEDAGDVARIIAGIEDCRVQRSSGQGAKSEASRTSPAPAAPTGILPSHTEAWQPTDVRHWLRSKGFGETVVSAFVSNEISGKDLLELSKEEIEDDLEISSPEDVAKLHQEISILAKTGPQRSATYTTIPSNAMAEARQGAVQISRAQTTTNIMASKQRTYPSPPLPAAPMGMGPPPQPPKSPAPGARKPPPMRPKSPAPPVNQDHAPAPGPAGGESSANATAGSSAQSAEFVAPVASWSTDTVRKWLVGIGVKAVVPTFQKNEIRGCDLLELSEEDLADDMDIDDGRIISAIVRGIALLKKGTLIPQKLFADKGEGDSTDAQTSKELADGWKEYVDPKGRKYYYNKRTRQKQWNRPSSVLIEASRVPESSNPVMGWTADQVADWLKGCSAPCGALAEDMRQAGVSGPDLLSCSREGLGMLGLVVTGEAMLQLNEAIVLLLKERASKYVALWAFQADKPTKLTVAAGTTVYLVEEVDDDWIRARDASGNYGLVPRRYLQIVEKSTPKKPRNLSRKRSMRNTMPMKESVRPAEWEVADVCQWLNDVGLGAYEGRFREEGLTGRALLGMGARDLETRGGVVDEQDREMLQNGIKILLADRVPRTPRQVKPCKKWTNDDVLAWLLEVGCGGCVPKCKQGGITGEDLLGRLNSHHALRDFLDDEHFANLLHRRILALVQSQKPNSPRSSPLSIVGKKE